jgi:hypothetical protein
MRAFVAAWSNAAEPDIPMTYSCLIAQPSFDIHIPWLFVLIMYMQVEIEFAYSQRMQRFLSSPLKAPSST